MANENTIKAVNDAIESAPKRKFTESVDLVVNLKNIDLSQPKNRITESIVLPKGRGKATKIGVFAKGDLAIKSESGGADLVISPEDIDKMSGDRKLIRSTTRDIDFFIAEAPLMPSIGKSFGPILGPKGKMPDPIPSSADPTPIINRLKRTVKVRTKDKTTFHALVGNLSMNIEDIAANIEALLITVESKLQNGTQNIASVYVKTTMGPAVRLM
ncbi:MAG: 50S ribosomal protein L1 [Euryarchaeota archaeon]|nr:50S ribosomal protein L1 [Euryarchaeota archaeon]